MKIIFPFIIGISLGLYNSHVHISAAVLFLSFIFTIISAFLFQYKKITNAPLRKKIASTLLLIVILFLGFLMSSLHRVHSTKRHFSNKVSAHNSIEVQIKEPTVEKENSVKIIAEVLSIDYQDSVYLADGKLLLYIKKDSLSLQLKYGDKLYLNTHINEVPPPLNPHQFDYKTYLGYQNIYHQAYADEHHWQLISQNNGNSIINKIFSLRTYCQQVIEKYIKGEREKAVAQAILIGNKDRLDEELVRSYSSSGAMHVLAVSGLHVGIIYLVFNFLLGFLDKNIKTRKFKPILLILLIWFYAILTGASPSVLRAATMFSFISIGTSLQRHINIYNVLASSAFVLILFNPFIVTEVGFQLSYFAVIGIIFLQPKIYRLYLPKNWLIDKIWALTAVSIAAQIATFPLGLLYFHQFPNLFMISNLVVIPAATIILYIGVSLLAFSWVGFVANILGIALNFVISLLNQFVAFIDKIPFSLSSQLDISHFQTFVIYGLIISLSVAIAFRQKKMLGIGLSFLLLFAITFSIKMYQIQTQKQLIVYSVPKTSAWEIIERDMRYSVFDSSLLQDDKQLLFNVKHNWWDKHIRHSEYIGNLNFTTIENNQFLRFEDKNILLIDSNYTLPQSDFDADIVIISHNPKLYLDNFTKKIKATKLIFDSSNPQWKIKYWEADCDSLGLDCYFVTDHYAYIEDF